jgi:hypothetical protein
MSHKDGGPLSECENAHSSRRRHTVLNVGDPSTVTQACLLILACSSSYRFSVRGLHLGALILVSSKVSHSLWPMRLNALEHSFWPLRTQSGPCTFILARAHSICPMRVQFGLFILAYSMCFNQCGVLAWRRLTPAKYYCSGWLK